MKKILINQRETSLAPFLKSGWSYLNDRDALTKTFTFVNFIEAFGWMCKAAIESEKLNHHPEWSNFLRLLKLHLQHMMLAV